jgi:hypothetical protein
MENPIHAVKSFCGDQSGAVTVDWVVLTAAIIGMAVAVLSSVGSGATTLATLTGSTLSATDTRTFPWENGGENQGQNGNDDQTQNGSGGGGQDWDV